MCREGGPSPLDCCPAPCTIFLRLFTKGQQPQGTWREPVLVETQGSTPAGKNEQVELTRCDQREKASLPAETMTDPGGCAKGQQRTGGSTSPPYPGSRTFSS